MRQYIGARYVTKIYENSLDPSSAEWEASVNYEPLTMVTYNNGSYLSKKEVPASIGDPASNPAYWVQTGFYNGQIAALDSRVSALEDKTDDLIGRKFLLVGDSLGMGVSVISGDPYYGKGWAGYASDYIGSDNVVWVSIDGGGFSEPGIHNWLYQLQNVNLGTHDALEFTDLVVLGGTNDYSDNAAAIETAISDFITYAHSAFPNLKRIALGALAEPKLCPDIRTRYQVCEKYGAEYISDLENLLCDSSKYDETGYYHLSQSGYEFYSPYICGAIVSGHTCYKFTFNKELTIAAPYSGNLSVQPGWTMPAITYEITEKDCAVGIRPSIGSTYSNTGMTLMPVTSFTLDVSNPFTWTIPQQVMFYDDTDSVKVVGFNTNAISRSNDCTKIVKYNEGILGDVSFAFSDYSLDSPVDSPESAYKMKIYAAVTFYDGANTASITGAYLNIKFGGRVVSIK